jgi:hypothetical protein
MTNGRVDSRFEISHPEHGLLGTETSLIRAFTDAYFIMTRKLTNGQAFWTEDFIEVYDSMAHVGCPQLWRLELTDEFEVGYKVSKTEIRTE